MKHSSHQFTLLWALLLLLTAVSALIAVLRTSDLPSLPVTLSPELRVRSVSTEQGASAGISPFQRDDRLAALRGRPIEDLREMRAALAALPEKAEAGEPLEAPQKPGASYLVTYQIVRPLHRFNLLLQGEPIDPLALPPGVEEGDKLVELDGRPMKPKVRTEGLRSIISSRPEALLVFERPDAVFTGEIEIHNDPLSEEVLSSFFVCFLLILLLWWRGHATLSKWTLLATALQTLAFAWCSLVIFEYQWVLADYTLAYGSIFAIVLARPLGIFARTASAENGGTRKWGSLALGLFGALVVIVALKTGRLSDAEVALQFSAILGMFFVVFEVALTGLSEDSGVLLGERSIFLSGIVFAILLASMVAYAIEPVAFAEERWRWFAAIVLGFVWIGDIVLCLGGLPMPPMAEISTSAARSQKIRELLEETAALAPQLEPALLGLHKEQGTLFTLDQANGMALVTAAAPATLADVATIFSQEELRHPTFDEAQRELVQQMVSSLGLGFALPLSAPLHGLEAPETALLLMGRVPEDRRETLDAGELIDPALLDELAALITPPRWAAALIELLAHDMPAPRHVTPIAPRDTDEAASEESEARAAEAREALDAARQKLAAREQELRALEDELYQMRLHYHPAPTLPEHAEELLEQDLVAALDYLLQQSAAPIALSGPRGAGKVFVATLAHRLDGREGGSCLCYEAALDESEAHAAILLGEGESRGGVLALCDQGSLIVEQAQWLDPAVMLDLCEQSEARDVRLYLCFEEPRPEERSLLEELGETVLDVLGDRELVIPPFSRRAEIREGVLNHWLEELAWRRGVARLELSPDAHAALLRYEWPGQIDELVVMLGALLSRLDGESMELSDLPPLLRTRLGMRREA